MQHSVTQGQAVEVDVMEVWKTSAQLQRAAFDAVAAYMCQQ